MDNKPCRILVVDDETIIVDFLRSLLNLGNASFQIETASSGDEAIAKASAFRPQLVVLDINIPGKDGFEVCQAIRAHPDCQKSRILAMTSDPQADRVQRILELGADECLQKPFPLNEFLEKVNAYCAQCSA